MRSEAKLNEPGGRDRKDMSKSDQIRREGSLPHMNRESGDTSWRHLLTKKTRRALEAYERKA